MSFVDFAKTLFHAHRDGAGEGAASAKSPTWESLPDAERARWLAVAHAADEAYRAGHRGLAQGQAPEPTNAPRMPGIPFVPPDADRTKGGF